MTLAEKVAEVEAVFDTLDTAIAAFQSSSSLHCLHGCGKCCFKPDIEATILEFLPFAYHLYRNHQAEDWLNRLEQEQGSVCLILNPTQAGAGLCSEYPHRGLICRLFGYSARTNKYGKNEFVTCQLIKTDQPVAYESAKEKVAAGMDIPVMNQYYLQLNSIDPSLSTTYYPINEAIRKAIEEVLHYYAYRNDEREN